jgi:hypothetical protein
VSRRADPRAKSRKEKRIVEAYCVKCKAKRLMKDTQEVVLKNGRPAIKGICTVCGTKVMRFVKKGS